MTRLRRWQECEADVDDQWNGLPEDNRSREEAIRRAYEMADAQETARNLGVSVLDVLQWEGRLSVRTIREPKKGE